LGQIARSEQFPPEDVLAVSTRRLKSDEKAGGLLGVVIFGYLGIAAVSLAGLFAYGAFAGPWGPLNEWAGIILAFTGLSVCWGLRLLDMTRKLL